MRPNGWMTRDRVTLLAALLAPFALCVVLVPFRAGFANTNTALLLVLLLLLVGVGVTELAAWGRRQHLLASRQAGYLAGIQAAAQVVAGGGALNPLSWGPHRVPAAAGARQVDLGLDLGRASLPA